MSGDTVITVCGNVTKDPELRWTNNGVAVAKFTVASTPRTYNRDKQAWEDGPTLFLPVTVWRQQAEHVAESVARGCRVVVQGRLSQRSYEDKQGVKRTVYELEGDEVAVSLRSATAVVSKAGGQGQGREQYQQARARSSQEGREDPWASSGAAAAAAAEAAQAGAWGGRGGDADDPPF
ncbi:single-stranded DNA-binding protein [Streptomyces sp. NBRC 110035]|uniref:single-stranded DNA-binding protein n=1 Tax=Streptomyces sp. NBRC 110035 TaxID=1547867 RepID=UPI0005A66EFE|nr:single-stranded DNA-binding protein [Streptomyces sp. NBRC 110035]